MAQRAARRKSKTAEPGALARIARRTRRWAWRGLSYGFLIVVLWVTVYALLPVPTTAYMWSESRRVDGVDYDWVAIEDISVHLQRAAVAAEDANFCLHWGFDMAAIREVIEDGGTRGASTISQQTVKNAFLWHGRSWVRKALEAAITPIMEIIWPKRRVLEVYLNIAEFDDGVFGAEAAAQHHFGVSATDLTLRQASLLAAILPAPQARSASAPSDWVSRRARSIADGAATIATDGRDGCFVN